MKNLEELFKQICVEEANNLNDFWDSSRTRLAELEVEISDEKLKERTRELRRIKLCEDIDEILNHDGYNGTAGEVIEYFSRTALNYTVRNAYFDIHPKLKGLYTLLQKSMKTEELEKLKLEKENIEHKMNSYSFINENYLYNSILKAFQAVSPKPNCEYNLLPPRFYESYERFPWNREVDSWCVNYELVDFYINSIDEYLRIPVKDLKLFKMQTLFK